MPQPSVIDRFARAAELRDASMLGEMMTPDVVLYASLMHRPFTGKDAVVAAFDMLMKLFGTIEYVSEHRSDDGVSLLVRMTIDGKSAEGAQFLTFDGDGAIVEFRDFIRPFSALEALRDATAEYLRAGG